MGVDESALPLALPSPPSRHCGLQILCLIYKLTYYSNYLSLSIRSREDNEDGILLQGAHDRRCKGPRRARVHTCGPRSPADDSQS